MLLRLNAFKLRDACFQNTKRCFSGRVGNQMDMKLLAQNSFLSDSRAPNETVLVAGITRFKHHRSKNNTFGFRLFPMSYQRTAPLTIGLYNFCCAPNSGFPTKELSGGSARNENTYTELHRNYAQREHHV